jgi:type II secretory pathway component PulF
MALAEKEGDLAAPLQRLAGLYRHQAEYLSRRGLYILEPSMVIAIGLFVLFIVMGMFAPLAKIVAELSGI